MPNKIVHGHAKRDSTKPEYRIWQAMWSRCTNANVPTYASYGGRGISVCRRWEKYEHFLSDMGRRPAGRRLGRLNVNGDYTPKNCSWVTLKESMNNRTDSKKVSYRGKRMSIADWGRETGINRNKISARLRAGWTAAEALTEP